MKQQQHQQSRRRTPAQKIKRNQRRQRVRNVRAEELHQPERSSSERVPSPPHCEHVAVVEVMPPTPAVQPEVKPAVIPKAKPKVNPERKGIIRVLNQKNVIFVKTPRKPVVLADSLPVLVVDMRQDVLSRPKIAEEEEEENLSPPLPLEQKENIENQNPVLEESLLRRPTRPTLFVPPQRPPLAKTSQQAPENARSLDAIRQRQLLEAKRVQESRAKVLVPTQEGSLRSRSLSRKRELRRLRRR